MFAIEEFQHRASPTGTRTGRQRHFALTAPAWLVELFFSEQLDDIAAAKAFCQGCPVKDPCLAGALERREPWGVWGGELFVNGKVVAQKRKRGRPPKDPSRSGTACRAQSA